MSDRNATGRVYATEYGWVAADGAGWTDEVYETEEEAWAAVRGAAMSDRYALRRPIMRLITAAIDDRIPGDPTLGQIADSLLAEIEPLIRADEDEKIAQPLDARAAAARSQVTTRSGPMAVAKYLEVAGAYTAAARIARNGGRDE